MAVHMINGNRRNQINVPPDILESIFERHVVRRCYENDSGQIVWRYTDPLTEKNQILVTSRYSQQDVDAIHAGMMRQRRKG